MALDYTRGRHRERLEELRGFIEQLAGKDAEACQKTDRTAINGDERRRGEDRLARRAAR